MHHFTAETQHKVYKPSESLDDSDSETIRSDSSKDKLNESLWSRDISPIRSKLKTTWHLTKERTERYYVKKARQAVHAVIEEIAPENTESLWEALLSSKACEFRQDTTDHADVILIEAVTECYNNAGHWSTHQQVLSTLVDKISFKMLKKWIPNLTRYRLDIARHHQLLHGRGAVVPIKQYTRMYVAPGQLSHFVNFITSTHIIHPSIILLARKNWNYHLMRNWLYRMPYEVSFQHRSFRNTRSYAVKRVSNQWDAVLFTESCISARPPSVRKSLQGLDYVGAQGAKAFEELEPAAEKLGDNCGLGLSWAKGKKEKLKVAKRFLN